MQKLNKFIAMALIISALSLRPSVSESQDDAMTIIDVCALSTTVGCWDFDTPGYGTEDDLYYCAKDGAPTDGSDPDRFLRDHPNGYGNCSGLDLQSSNMNVIANTNNRARRYVYPKRTLARSEFSDGASLVLRIISQSGPQASGDFSIPFKRIGEPGRSRFAQFGPGGEFWIRWAAWENAALAGDASEGGVFLQPYSAAAKRLIVHGRPSSPGYKGGLQHTFIDGFQRRNAELYGDSGNHDYGIQGQPGTGTAWPNIPGGRRGGCVWQGNNDPASYPEPPCFKWPVGKWTVYHMHAVNATNAPAYDNGYVEIFVGDDPDALPIIAYGNGKPGSGPDDRAFGHATPLPPYTESGTWGADDPEGYGKASFTLFTTGKDSSQVHAEMIMHIDNVVISRIRTPPLLPAGARPVPGDSRAAN